MKNDLKEIRYSPPVEEIMGNPPRVIVRWGSSLFGIIVIIFFVASWFIRYPYIVATKVEITSDNPPVNIVSRVPGIIDPIFVKDGQKVRENEILAVMESATSLDAVDWISQMVDSVYGLDNIGLVENYKYPQNPELGEIQDSYSEFLKASSDYFSQVHIDPLGKNIQALENEIKVIDDYINELRETEKLYGERLVVERTKYLRDSTLLSSGTIAEGEFDNSRQAYLAEKIKLQETRLARYLKMSEKQGKEASIVKMRADREERLSTLAAGLTEAKLKLLSRIDWWRKNYLLISPIDGEVSFNKFWGEKQAATEGETIMTIVPGEETEIIGRAWLSMKGSGKVKAGLSVNIRLDGYPYLEYGMIRGRVKSISLAPVDELYLVSVELPDGLKTFYGKELPFTQNMTGTAEIIAEDMRLIERILYPFKFFFEKNRNT